MVIVTDPTACADESPLLHHHSTVPGVVDYQGRPVNRSSSGGWRSASFIIGVEVAERFAFYGISSNLISYLTGPLGQSTAAAAENVNLWSGVAMLLPLVGASVADSFLGRYRTIVIASIIYALGFGLLTLSIMFPSGSSSACQSTTIKLSSCSLPQLQVVLFFFSLYLVAVGQGGHKPCIQAFGADQFDGHDPEESKAKSSFFNWWYFGICVGVLAASLILNYIQDYLSWALGFGIPTVLMMVALLVFLLGTKTYRYSFMGDEKSPFDRIGRVFASAFRNRKMTSSAVAFEEEARGTLPHRSSEEFRFLNKALLSPDGSKEDGKLCSPDEVEEAKAILRLIPIWSTCLVYAIVFAQVNTFFTKQGATMDRSITPTFTIPAASLQSLAGLSIVLFIPIYDRLLVPAARVLTNNPSGITMLQRIGFGLFLSIISMAIAALVESKRLKTAEFYGIIDLPNETVPMRVWWLVPQYTLVGIADVFTVVGLQEFFYDQVPDELRSVGLGLYLSILGIGSLLSGVLVTVIEKATGGDGGDGWFCDNLNRGHVDYFYWLLAGLSALALVAYLCFAKSYVYNKKSA